MGAIRRRPLLALLVAASLALTIAAAAAVASVADRAVWRRLRFDRAEDLVHIQNLARRHDFELVAALTAGRVCDGAATYDGGRLEFRLGRAVGSVRAAEVTSGLFTLLGVKPVAGRLPVLTDEHDDGGVAVLGERLWRRQFDTASDVIGMSLATGRREYRVIGVAPATLDALGGAELFLVRRRSLQGVTINGKEGEISGILGRLHPGTDVGRAAREVAALARSLSDSAGTEEPRVQRLTQTLGRHDGLLGPGAVLAVLVLFLVGTANAGFLYLGWMEGRRMELVTKMALGASPGLLYRELATEWFALLGLAGTAGFLLARWCEQLAVELLPSVAHYLQEPRLGTLAGSTVALSGVAATMIPLLAYMFVLRPDGDSLACALRQGGTGLCTSPRARLRGVLVTLQISLGVALVSVALVLWHGFRSLVAVTPGFEPRQMIAISIWRPPVPIVHFPGPGVPPPGWNEARIARASTERDIFHQRVIAAYEGIPGVRAVGATSSLPLSPAVNRMWADDGDPRRGMMTAVVHVAGDYFAAAGLQVQRGRTLRAGNASSSSSAVIDDVAAARLWPGVSPIGRHLRIAHGKPREIVGVVGQLRGVAPSEGTVYVPNADPVFAARDLHIVIRLAGALPDDGTLVSQASTVDPDALGHSVITGDGLLDRAFGSVKAQLFVFVLAAAFATTLCAVGVFGATTQWLLERRREMALRMALGAGRHRVVGLALRQVLLMAGWATGAGLGLGWITLRILRGALLVVEATFVALVPGVILTLAIALATAYSAAWRATEGCRMD